MKLTKDLKPSLNEIFENPMGIAVNNEITEAELKIGIRVAGVALIKFDYIAEQVTLSPEAVIMYGLPSNDFVISQVQFYKTCHPDDYRELLSIIKQALNSSGAGFVEYEHRVVLPTGAIRWLHVRQQFYFNGFGEQAYPIGAILAAMDVTDQKYLENALKEQNKQLDEFTYVVSHDLKAPLRGISRVSEWIEEDLQGLISDETAQQIYLLRHRVDRLSLLIDELLHYARTIHTEPTIESVDLEELLSEIIDLLVPPATFKIIISPNLPQLYTKRLLLAQVLMNLISNSIKHHDRAEGVIQIVVKGKGDFYEFSVTDDGPGIPVDQQNCIFNIFQTGGLRFPNDNTGIGLAIVKRIIENESGTIYLHSQGGRGATFSFTWPK